MRLITASALLLAAMTIRDRWWPGLAAPTVWLVPLFVLSPLIGVSVVLVAGAVGVASRLRSKRLAERDVERDVSLMARVILIAVSAGLPLPASFHIAAQSARSDLGSEVDGLIRNATRLGMAEALRCHEGRIERLTFLLARAQVTGASISGAVEAFVAERRDDERAGALEAARRLPVKLTIPLALLILPGFVVLTVGPTVLDSASRLLGPVLSIP